MKTYGTLRLLGETWSMDGVSPNVIIRLKQLFPRIPKAAAPPYHFQRTLTVAADLVWFLSRYPMEMSAPDLATLYAARDGHDNRVAELEKVLLADYVPPLYPGLREGEGLRQYQAQAVELLMRSGGLLCGDEVGLGKTFVAAGAMIQPGALPCAVVCQTHLQTQWARVIERMTHLRVHMIKGTRPYRLPPADVYLFRFTQLLGWVDTFEAMKLKMVVWDETQELRTGDASEKGRAAGRLADVVDYRLGLTATPIYNYGSEIWPIMRYVNSEVLGSFGDFTREWCQARGNGKWSVSNPVALGAYLRDEHCFLRRTKHDVGQQVPPVNQIVDTVDFDEATVKSVEAMAHALAIKATTASFEERGRAVRDLDILMRQTTGVAKAKAVATFTAVVVEAGEPVLLFGWHREVYAIWQKAFTSMGVRFGMYTGSETSAEKERNKNAFLAGETDILILSLRSGSGLDGLQARCSTAIFGELDWSPGVHHQCIGRLDREGQTSPVTAIFLTVDEGSDPPMIEVLGLKKTESSGILDPGLGVQAVRSDASHLQTLVQRYLRKRAT